VGERVGFTVRRWRRFVGTMGFMLALAPAAWAAGPPGDGRGEPPTDRGAPPAERSADALPDGAFGGELRADDGPRGTLEVVVAGGMMIDARATLPGGDVMELHASGSRTSREIGLTGRSGASYVRITGSFFDLDRGSGTFEGVISRRKVKGTWTLVRR